MARSSAFCVSIRTFALVSKYFCTSKASKQVKLEDRNSMFERLLRQYSYFCTSKQVLFVLVKQVNLEDGNSTFKRLGKQVLLY